MLDLRPNKWLKKFSLSVMDEVVLFVFNNSEYGIGVKLCYLALLRDYFLVSYNTNITQILAGISNFFHILWLMSCTVLDNIYFAVRREMKISGQLSGRGGRS